MDTNSKVTQFKAGFFVLLGLISIGALILYFGRFGESVKKFYPLTVEYRNASGLLKGADVLLAGARIGEVSDAPKVLPNMQGVEVKLKIDEAVQIPQGSVFSIGSSGLLGDRFVTVTMREDALDQKPIPAGSSVHGERESSIADLQRQIGEVLPKVYDAVENINEITDKLKKDVFNEQGVRNLQLTLQNFKITSEALAASSGQIKGVTDQATLFLKKGNNAMESASGAAGDLKVFIANLRQHGIIFYRDTTTGGPVKKQ